MFYGLSVVVMVVRELSFYIVTGKVTADLRLAVEQLFYLLSSVVSILYLYAGLHLLLSNSHKIVIENPTQTQQTLQVIINHGLFITFVSVLSISALFIMGDFFKSLIVKRNLLTAKTL